METITEPQPGLVTSPPPLDFLSLHPPSVHCRPSMENIEGEEEEGGMTRNANVGLVGIQFLRSVIFCTVQVYGYSVMTQAVKMRRQMHNAGLFWANLKRFPSYNF